MTGPCGAESCPNPEDLALELTFMSVTAESEAVSLSLHLLTGSGPRPALGFPSLGLPWRQVSTSGLFSLPLHQLQLPILKAAPWSSDRSYIPDMAGNSETQTVQQAEIQKGD